MNRRDNLAYSRALVPKKVSIIKLLFLILIIALITAGIIFFVSTPDVPEESISGDTQSNEVVINVIKNDHDKDREIGIAQMKIDYIYNGMYSISYPEVGIEEIDEGVLNIARSLKNHFIEAYLSDDDKSNTTYSQHVDYQTHLVSGDVLEVIFEEMIVKDDQELISQKAYKNYFDIASGAPIVDGIKLDIVMADSDDLYDASNVLNYVIGSDEYVSVTSGENIVITKEFVPIDDENRVRYALANVNVRQEASMKSKIITSLTEGDSIEITATNGEWDRVYTNNMSAYIKSGYLSTTKPIHREIKIVLKSGDEYVGYNSPDEIDFDNSIVINRRKITVYSPVPDLYEKQSGDNLPDNYYYTEINHSKPMVAITYDDGPNTNSTSKILDTLEKYGVVATFFDLGQLVNTYPTVVKREEEIGCEVGSHSYSHKNFNVISEKQMREEISKSEDAFENALGHKPRLFRPPYGNANYKVKGIVDYPLFTWNVDSLDWKSRNKKSVLEQIKKTKNFDGHIILMHSIYNSTAQATEELVPYLLKQGYQLLTIPELAYYRGYDVLRAGVIYKDFNVSK